MKTYNETEGQWTVQEHKVDKDSKTTYSIWEGGRGIAFNIANYDEAHLIVNVVNARRRAYETEAIK